MNAGICILVSMLLLNANFTVDGGDGGGINKGNENEVKIYGDYAYAQSFKPYIENLTEIKIEVEASIHLSRTLEFILSILDRIIPLPYNMSICLNDLIIELRDDNNGKPGNVLASKRFSRKEVENSNGLVVWKLDKPVTLIKPIDMKRYGYDIDENERYGSKTYYIVVRAEGGNPWFYYTWRFGEEYEEGEAYAWLPASKEWRTDEIHVEGKDFSFNITGGLAYEKGDGITRHYAILGIGFGLAETVKTALSGYEKIYYPNPIITNEDILKYLEEIDALSDGDDIILLWIVGWSYHDEKCVINGLSAYAIEKRFSRMKTEGICMIFDCCYAGKFADPEMCCLAKPGRVILTSCAYGEIASTRYDEDGNIWWTFTYYLYQGLKDPEVENTAENLFRYAYKPTQKGGSRWVDPQMYDGYEGELPI